MMHRPARPGVLSVALVLAVSLGGVGCGGEDRSPTAVESIDGTSISTSTTATAPGRSTTAATASSTTNPTGPGGGTDPSPSTTPVSTPANDGTS
ncbi:MAG: hypothetical protein ACKOD2_10040, partial [Ilumatobacteraceae bacterium]